MVCLLWVYGDKTQYATMELHCTKFADTQGPDSIWKKIILPAQEIPLWRSNDRNP